MTVSAPRPRPLAQGLGVRLAFAFAMALLPLGVISGLQSKSLLDEAQARAQAALLGETLLAASGESGLIRGARVAVAALAATVTALPAAPQDCSAVLLRVLELSGGAYSFVAYVPPSRVSVCNSRGEPLDLTTSERAERMEAEPRPDVVVIRNGVASQTSVLAFGHPVVAPDGTYQGYVSISMPHSVLEGTDLLTRPIETTGRLEPIALMTFDAAGTILTSSTGLDDAPSRMPGGRPLTDLVSNTPRTFVAMSGNGNERVYAVFPLVDDQIFAIGSWPIIVAEGPLSLWVSPYLLPGAMWAASLLVAMLAAERLVTRHIRSLRRAITSFAAGDHRGGTLDLSDAAVEFRDVAEAYLKMTDSILHDEAELEDIVHQREVLLREVHHRVKNNLQLIVSIMNMQMRQSHSAETKSLMKGLQDRVMSLATIHRGLYQTSGLADVRADELLSDIVRQIIKMATGPGRRFDVTTHFDDLRLTPDQAVPLSLLLTEALTNALKYAGSTGPGSPSLDVALRREDGGMASLTVTNSLGTGGARARDGTGLGSQLLTAFAVQLHATNVVTHTDGSFVLRVTFALRALSEAEASRSPMVEDSEDEGLAAG